MNEQMQTRIRAIFHRWQQGICPGGQVLVRRGGQTVFEECFGYADVENQVPVTPETVFHAASVSKQFTVMLVLLLCQEGLVELEEDIRRYVSRYVGTDSPITVHDLMSNCSGLRDLFELQDLMGISNDDLTSQDFVLKLNARQKGVNFPARSRFSYCNTNFSLLAAIAEAVTGKPFPQLLQERILKPLGMEHSQVCDRYWLRIPGRACSYTDDGTAFHYNPLLYGIYGGTCLNTTARDLARWMENYRSCLVCSPETVRLMSTPTQLKDNAPTTYGCGLWGGVKEGLRYFMHVGEDAGFRSITLRLPEEDVDVVILSNTDNTYTEDSAWRIVRILLELPEKEAPALPTGEPLKSLSEAVGFYYASLPSSGIFVITEQAGQLFLRQKYGLAPLTPVENRLYRLGRQEVYFLLGEDAPRCISPEGTVALTKAQDAPLSPALARRCEGRYLSPELDAVYTVTFEEGRLYLDQLRRGKTPLHPVEGCRFVTEYARSCFVEFLLPEDGPASGLTLSGVRVSALPFTRLS